jgi:hypothetical protein
MAYSHLIKGISTTEVGEYDIIKGREDRKSAALTKLKYHSRIVENLS